MTAPREAFFSLSAESTLWNTSCCGIEPNPIVKTAESTAIIEVKVTPSAQKSENFPSCIAREITDVVPPALSEKNHATATIPTSIIIIWKKSVIATDHIPQNIVYTRTMIHPITDHCDWVRLVRREPSETISKTSHSATICADTHPI